MNILGSYLIDVYANQAYVSKSILPFFCNGNNDDPSLSAYLLNILPGERAAVEKKLFAAIYNLSAFDVEHHIKPNYKMMKIKNFGKTYLSDSTNTKKISGSIICLNQFDSMILNTDVLNNENQSLKLEFLLNNFVRKQKPKAA